MPSCRGMQASRVCSCLRGKEKPWVFNSILKRKKKNHAKRASDREIRTDLWLLAPELHLWHQGYDSVSSSPCRWWRLPIVCRPRKNKMIICRFPESLLESSLSLSYQETLQDTRHSRMSLQGLWGCAGGGAGISPRCFCLWAGDCPHVPRTNWAAPVGWLYMSEYACVCEWESVC